MQPLLELLVFWLLAKYSRENEFFAEFSVFVEWIIEDSF